MRKNFLNDLVFRTRLIGFEYHLDSKRELMQGKSVFGYKVFGPGWLCENSSLRDVDSRDGEIIVYGFGMDFYKSLTECFKYYDFDNNNRVAEVVASQNIKTEGDRSFADEIYIIREIPWDEVERIVNAEKNHPDDENGDECDSEGINIGEYNTGRYNTGDLNVGNRNQGTCNVGDMNRGHENVGNCNRGNFNTGNKNNGSWNTGESNTGGFNTGNGNKGMGNSGNWNVGSYNIGDWNQTSYSTGAFNTEMPKITLFNKPSNMTGLEWKMSAAKVILDTIPVRGNEWIPKKYMTETEKKEHPTYKTEGGFLKSFRRLENAQRWWNELPDEDKQEIKGIQNFDADIFFQCTGIRVD